MRKFLCVLLSAIMVLALIPVSAITIFASEDSTPATLSSTGVTVTNGEYSLSVEKTSFAVGEAIMVTATGSGTDWVGIYNTNQSASITYEYVSTYGSGVSFDARTMSKQGSGYTEELASLPEGRYVLRLVPNNKSDISETVCHIVITVGSPSIVEGDSSLMSVEKNIFAPGESIMVSGKGSGKDWIGIYKINTHNVTYSNMWKYISAVGEDTEFDITSGAGLSEGDYLLCLIKNDASKPINASAWALITIKEGGGEQTPDDGGDDNTGTDSGNTGDGGEGGNTGGTEDDTIIVPEGMVKYTSENGQILVLKTEYTESEAVYVYAKGVNTKDWVGITERGNTDAAIRWQYIDSSVGGAGQGEGFDLREASNIGGTYRGSEIASLPAGEYTIHLVENDGYIKNGATTIAVDITIRSESTGDDSGEGGEGSGDSGDTGGEEITPSELLSVEKTTFTSGEPIMVTAISSNDTDWVGIFNTSGNYLKWHYVTSSLSGVAYDVTQGTTIPAGVYTIRLIPKDGAKDTTPLASIEITVVDAGLQGPSSATYTLDNDSDGFAKGTITVTMPNDQTDNRSIVMYWADENGKLEGYTSLARFKVTGEQTSFTFTDSMVIPEGATRLLVYAQATESGILSEEYIAVDLPSNSDMTEQNVINSIFIISDIHIGKSGSAENFKKMLNEAIALKPNGTAIFIVGDMADNGSEAQFAEMMSLHSEVMEANGKDASKYPLFLTLGNHDYPAMTGTFLKYATLPDGTHPTDTSYDFWLDGYHYIFLGSDTNAGLYANLTEETLTWLDEKLSEDRDESRPTFVFLHQPMYNTVSGSLPGEGWNGVNNEEALRAVLCKYPEAMLFNGHTHWTMDSAGNIFEGTAELPIHIFNCASVSYLWSGYNIITGEGLNGSQGYFVEMYDGAVFVRGRDFINGEWISSAQYLIELTEGEHIYTSTKIEYKNGFGKDGVITYSCSHCSAIRTESVNPIIVPKGYSVRLDTSRGYGICGGYAINYAERVAYEKVNGVVLELGVAMFNPEKLSDSVFFKNGLLTVTEGALQVRIKDTLYSTLNFDITGIEHDDFDLDLVISAYVTEISGTEGAYTYKTSFVQYETTKSASTFEKADGTLHSISYASLTQ